ncbi:ABC transporter, periplasmic substrate-binding protein YnjB [Vibrio sp. JCM 19053]|nr:ABC transporter, periplasmic substrate-binding protein YnjB [Vibrio sp. JCM 19053]
MKKLLSSIGILATTFATPSFADSSVNSEWQKNRTSSRRAIRLLSCLGREPRN